MSGTRWHIFAASVALLTCLPDPPRPEPHDESDGAAELPGSAPLEDAQNFFDADGSAPRDLCDGDALLQGERRRQPVPRDCLREGRLSRLGALVPHTPVRYDATPEGVVHALRVCSAGPCPELVDVVEVSSSHCNWPRLAQTPQGRLVVSCPTIRRIVMFDAGLEPVWALGEYEGAVGLRTHPALGEDVIVHQNVTISRRGPDGSLRWAVWSLADDVATSITTWDGRPVLVWRAGSEEGERAALTDLETGDFLGLEPHLINQSRFNVYSFGRTSVIEESLVAFHRGSSIGFAQLGDGAAMVAAPGDTRRQDPHIGSEQYLVVAPTGRGTGLAFINGHLVEAGISGIVSSTEMPPGLAGFVRELVNDGSGGWYFIGGDYLSARMWSVRGAEVLAAPQWLEGAERLLYGPYVLSDGSVLVQTWTGIERHHPDHGLVWEIDTGEHGQTCSRLAVRDGTMTVMCSNLVYRWQIGLELAPGLSAPGFDNYASNSVWTTAPGP